MYWFIFIIISFNACEKKIEFDLKQAETVLAVDANIENDLPPVVVLTNSLGYFSKIDTSIINNMFVHGADVYISNGVLTHKLKEYPVPIPTQASRFTNTVLILPTWQQLLPVSLILLIHYEL